MTEMDLRALRTKLIYQTVQMIRGRITEAEKERITEASIKMASYPTPGPEDEAINELENVVVGVAKKYGLDEEVREIVDRWSYDMVDE